MPLQTRRLILLTFVVLFLITAPITILFTEGYRYNIKKNKLEKIGAFVFVTDPEIVDIVIDNETFSKNKNILIESFLPDTHYIKIQKQGYHSWEKEMEIKPNETTFVRNVKLFKDSVPESLMNEKIQLIEYSPDQTEAIVSNGSKLTQIILSPYQEKELFDIPKNYKLEKISWSKDNSKVLLSLPDEELNTISLLINPQNPQNKTYLPSRNVKKFFWHPTRTDLIYALKNNSLDEINISDSTETKVIESESIIQDIYISDKNIYFITKDPKTSKSKIFSQTQDKKETLLGTIPTSEKFNLKLSLNKKYLLLLDQDNNIMYFINHQKPAQSSIVSILSQITDCINTNSDERFICYNDFEITDYDITSNKKDLIARFGEIINQVIFLKQSNYVALLINNTIQLIEFDQYGKKNIINLTRLEEISNFSTLEENDKIFFIGKVGNKQGLFQQEL